MGFVLGRKLSPSDVWQTKRLFLYIRLHQLPKISDGKFSDVEFSDEKFRMIFFIFNQFRTNLRFCQKFTFQDKTHSVLKFFLVSKLLKGVNILILVVSYHCIAISIPTEIGFVAHFLHRPRKLFYQMTFSY